MLTTNQSLLLYAGVMLWAGIFIFIAQRKRENLLWRISFDVLAGIPIFFIMAFRYDVGIDYFFTYIPSFKNIANGMVTFPRERGFYLINKFLQLFTMQSQSIIILTSLIYVIFLVWIVDEESVNPVISIIVLFAMTLFFVALNNIRQQGAAILCFWGFRYVRKKEFAKYLTTVILATFFFHQTAILLIFIYPIVNFKYLQKYCYIWMPLLLTAIPLLAKLFYVILELFGYNYGDNPNYQHTNGNWDLLFVNSFIFAILLISFRTKIIKDRITYGLFAIQFLTFVVCILSMMWKMLEIPDRVTYYLMMYQLLSLPLAIHNMFNFNKICGFLVIILFGLVSFRSFYYIIYKQGYHEVLPYQFVFGHWDELKVEKPKEEKILGYYSFYFNDNLEEQ